ncbi:MAG TPA: hypothetical protein VK978_05300 [Candidatus Saccharimonadales bacterium]|nr:hypothetical protein [Candidatus Saccharimonadales bacterium]
MNDRHGRELHNAPLKNVYVARTVETPQPKYGQFLERAARLVRYSIGNIAVIRTAASTHITYLETKGVKNKFRQEGFSGSDVRAFRADLEQHIKSSGNLSATYARTVKIDRAQPLVWKGVSKNKIALNVVADDSLLSERATIEEFLENRFGSVPAMRSFDPHITIGEAHTAALSWDQRRDPIRLISRDVQFPKEIALNGLMAFLGRIDH